MAMMMHAHPTDRRQFLKVAGSALVVSIGLPSMLPGANAATLARRWPAVVPADRVNSFLAIGPDGMVTVYCGHVDLGTGVRTALAQIVAEELDVSIGQRQCCPRRYRQDPRPGPDHRQRYDPGHGDPGAEGRRARLGRFLVARAAQHLKRRRRRAHRRRWHRQRAAQPGPWRQPTRAWSKGAASI